MQWKRRVSRTRNCCVMKCFPPPSPLPLPLAAYCQQYTDHIVVIIADKQRLCVLGVPRHRTDWHLIRRQHCSDKYCLAGTPSLWEKRYKEVVLLPEKSRYLLMHIFCLFLCCAWESLIIIIKTSYCLSIRESRNIWTYLNNNNNFTVGLQFIQIELRSTIIIRYYSQKYIL